METSKTSTPSSAPSRGLAQAMRRRPLLSFFVMAYAFSWIMTIPCILAEWGYLPKGLFNLFFVIKAFAGPFLAAFIMVNLTEGEEGVLRFRHRFAQVRAGWQWYVFILLGIPALFVLGIIVQPGALASFKGFTAAFPVVYLINFIIIFFGGGPLAEEPGWRGFALPRLQLRYGPLWGNLILGVVWTFWHLPDFFTSAQGGGPGIGLAAFASLPSFFLLVMIFTFIISWVYNHTGGSLFIAILLHASLNTTGILLPYFPAPNVSPTTLGNLALGIGLAIPAVLILILTRGRLGYKPEQAD